MKILGVGGGVGGGVPSPLPYGRYGHEVSDLIYFYLINFIIYFSCIVYVLRTDDVLYSTLVS